jgi:hypothetical protein
MRPRKPRKVWAYLEYEPKVRDQSRLPALKAEREILTKYLDNWDVEKI